MTEILEVLKYPDPTLRRGGKAIQEFDAGLRETTERMLATMYAYRGVGLPDCCPGLACTGINGLCLP